MNIQIIEDLRDDFHYADKSMHEKIETFFDSHKGFFDCAPKKVSFLVGMLVQKLLNIQGYYINATPFRSKLQGLRLTETLIRRLSWEVHEKVEQYRKQYKKQFYFFKELEPVISQLMVVGENNWKITNDEICFYFTTGMNLINIFDTEKKETQNDDSNE